MTIDFAKTPPKKPAFLGIKSFRDYDLAELADYIDWTPFFQTWELTGRFPAILDDPKVGEVARSLYDDARKMLDLIVKEKWFKAQATIGFWPANADGDDIVVYADDSRKKQIATFHTLRQQLEKREGRFNAALSDFIAPVATGVPDYIGAFVVTAGIGEDVIADRFKNANDDYSSILCKALADRLAEAFAERMHARVRREFWGYAPDETLAPDELILEQYARHPPGARLSRAARSHREGDAVRLLDAENTAGVKLTESFAMWPGSSVSGLYFSHPESYYFGVGKIERDQVEDYAARKGWSVAETERWLAPVLKLADARANAVTIDFAKTPPKKPTFLGIKSFRDYDLGELADYIDWTPFFQTWELTGRYPAILDDPKVGEVARSLYDDARKMLDLIIKENWFKAQATIGFWPANADGDDIIVYADDSRKQQTATFHTLRQQLEKREGRFNAALCDFIAPVSADVPDYIGAFVVTAGIGEDVIADRFKNANDDYSSILCKALADRLAEAFAERMHARVRREFWSYAPDEALLPDQLILEQYQGIRPAPGYPAQPDHTEKATLFALLDAERTAGVKLTESYAMWPGSSVSGLYFSHPESFYFGVGKIERDQVDDYAARKGWTVAETERWLAPVLNYIPAQDQSAQDRRLREAMPTLAPSSAAPANDAASQEMLAHPPGCNCAVHLAYRKKAARG